MLKLACEGIRLLGSSAVLGRCASGAKTGNRVGPHAVVKPGPACPADLGQCCPLSDIAVS